MPRAAATRELPPPLELLCLTALWSLGTGNVKDVRRAIAGTRSLAYTTVMTVLDRLARKGILSRHKVGRAHVYAPLVSRESIRRLALRAFVDAYFDGSEEQLQEFLHAQPAGLPRQNGETAAEERLDTALL